MGKTRAIVYYPVPRGKQALQNGSELHSMYHVQGPYYMRDPLLSPEPLNVVSSVTASWKALLNAELYPSRNSVQVYGLEFVMSRLWLSPVRFPAWGVIRM